jgi:adenine-specific DNA-methyltransferase
VAKRSKSESKSKSPTNVETLRHTDDKRINIPTAEHQSVLEAQHLARKEVRYPRNTDLDPQLVWRGKDYQDWSDLVVQAPPLYIQEKVHPKVLIDDLLRESKGAKSQASGAQIDLFADFNGVAEGADRTDFYQHEQNWTNRMILGDSLQVMASLAEREGLRGKVQCIYFDPPYGIKFNSNFQWSTNSRDVKEKASHITREPEQVKAFRDTWRDGIHTYLTYLRDRLTCARDLLAASGSVFVQIGDENVHLIRAVMDEVFGQDNIVTTLVFAKTASQTSRYIPAITDYVLWYAKDYERLKYRPLFEVKGLGDDFAERYDRGLRVDGETFVLNQDIRRGVQSLPNDVSAYSLGDLTSQRQGRSTGPESAMGFSVAFQGRSYSPTSTRGWSTTTQGIARLNRAGRLEPLDRNLRYRRVLSDFPATPRSNVWVDVTGVQSRSDPKVYVVQTATSAVQRCVLMTSDPGDLVLDPTCGSGTTAYVAEQWGRRWITIDTSRVALALARARLMGSRYPYYVLSDSPDGLRKEAEISGRAYTNKPTHGNVRLGFVCERVPHVTLRSIASDAEIDVIWNEHQAKIQDALERMTAALRPHNTRFRVTTGGREGSEVRFDAPPDATFTMPGGDVVSASVLTEWEVPREAPPDWPATARQPLQDFWDARIARQKAIDISIAAKAEFEFLYDKPYSDPRTIRVAGPFTVESLSPHRMLGVDENDELIDPLQVKESGPPYGQTFEQMILDNLRAAGVQQAHKEDRITFASLTPWPGEMVCAEGRFREGDKEKRAAIFIGPEFGTVSRPDLVQAAREAGDAGFDVLIACAFNYEAHASEFHKLGRVPVLKARMNADLHMGGELKATGTGNLFVIFGEPDIKILRPDDGTVIVHVKGVDVFDPTRGEVRSDGAEGIACWFIDTDYNEESFFVRHAYFLGQNDPYGALKTTLKAEIDVDTWATLNSDKSRPFPMPTSGRIAVKVINHLGDEVMKVYRVESHSGTV